MKRINTFLLVLGVLAMIAPRIHAQVGLKKIAQSTMNFLTVSVSPKASAMGEAFCAVGNGAESIFFNPAGIVESDNTFDLKMYATQWIADINYMAGALAWNAGKYGSIGLSVLTVDYGSIRWTSLISASERELYPLGYKDNGQISNVGAYSFGLTYGRAISTQFLIGGNMRLVGQNLGQSLLSNGMKDNSATKLVFDAGVKYFTGLRSIRFGMAIRNFSTNIKREEIEEQLPVLFTMGVALDLFDIVAPKRSGTQALMLAVDFLHPNNYSERMNIGLEYKLFDKVALRGGYQTNQDIASWSAGLGVNSSIGGKHFEFDYSYSNFDIFDGVNRLAVGIAF